MIFLIKLFVDFVVGVIFIILHNFAFLTIGISWPIADASLDIEDQSRFTVEGDRILVIATPEFVALCIGIMSFVIYITCCAIGLAFGNDCWWII